MAIAEPHERISRWVWPLVIAVAAAACGHKDAPPAGPGSVAAGASGAATAVPVTGSELDRWEQGPAALEKALAAHTPVLLYVSSEWCPPCRALEANVLSKQAFWDATKGVAHVRIDGDSDGAQAIAERFEARAYPTLLLLGADGQEVFRAHHAISLDEIGPALASAAAAGQGFEDALGRFQKGAATAADCGLFAAVDWSPASAMTLGTEAQLAALKQAFEQCGASPPAVRGILASHLLGLAATADTWADSAQPGAAMVPLQNALLDTVFQSDDTAWAARTLVTTWTSPVVQWVLGSERGPRFAALRGRWLAAAAAIRARPGAPLDMQLLGYNAVLDFHHLEHGDSASLDSALRDEIQGAVARVDALAKSPAERHAVVPEAAYLLRRTGQPARARDMLVAEIGKTDSPSYYQTTLSQWALQDGHRDEARRFARDAVTSARGRTSRLQWMVNELALYSGDSGDTGDRKTLLSRAAETYDLLFAQNDAFLGRNRPRGERLAELLSPLHEDASVQAIVEKYGARCDTLPEESRPVCRKHFDALKTGVLR